MLALKTFPPEGEERERRKGGKAGRRKEPTSCRRKTPEVQSRTELLAMKEREGSSLDES